MSKTIAQINLLCDFMCVIFPTTYEGSFHFLLVDLFHKGLVKLAARVFHRACNAHRGFSLK